MIISYRGYFYISLWHLHLILILVLHYPFVFHLYPQLLVAILIILTNALDFKEMTNLDNEKFIVLSFC